MLALGCEVVAAVAAGAVGSYSRLLRAAGGAWQRERLRPSRDIFLQMSSGLIWIIYGTVRSTCECWVISMLRNQPGFGIRTGRCWRQLCRSAYTPDQWGRGVGGGGVVQEAAVSLFLALGDGFLLLATTAPTHHTQPGWNAVMKQWGQNKNMPKLKANPHILHH